MITRVAEARAQWAGLDQRIAAFDTAFIRWTKENEDARRLASIPGVGPTIASALIAAIGKGETFEHGRDLAAWLGLVPPQFATGGRPKLLGVGKRGNRYLRKLLIHGASGVAPCRRARHAARPMGQSTAAARPSQGRHCGVRQQARQDRLGGAAARRKVRRQGTALGGLVVGRGRAEAR